MEFVDLEQPIPPVFEQLRGFHNTKQKKVDYMQTGIYNFTLHKKMIILHAHKKRNFQYI